MGHGTLLLIFGLGLVFMNEKLKGTAAEPLLMARYIAYYDGFLRYFQWSNL